MSTPQLSDDPIERCKQIMARQSNYPLQFVLEQLKFSRPADAQALIDKFIAEVKVSGIRTTFDWDTITQVFNKGEKP